MSEVCTACGWIGAIISCISFGSFAVPIKSESSTKCNIDPLAFQTYKTSMCFVTSLVATPLFHHEFHFTPWGIVSGIFWVPAGTAAIYAVKQAGLALSQGIWSSLIVLVSFAWGIFFFGEKVRSRAFTTFAILTMVCGLCGMSFYSTGPINSPYNKNASDSDGLYVEANLEDELGHTKKDMIISLTASKSRKKLKRRYGLAAAIFNGTWGASITVPMKFAPREAKGSGFIFSFSVGASIVTALLWILRFMNTYYQTRNLRKSYNALPSLHLSSMWKSGCLSGLLWSIGNISSLISVQNLGVGVGYALTQASMLCSGLWGVFYFREITSLERRCKWFLSALITILGIILLSRQHLE